jgi:hypothetical protein
MIRSIMVKGIEALTAEMMLAASGRRGRRGAASLDASEKRKAGRSAPPTTSSA